MNFAATSFVDAAATSSSIFVQDPFSRSSLLSLLMNHIEIPILVKSGEGVTKDQFVMCNRFLADMYETTPEEMVGKYDKDYVPEELFKFYGSSLDIVVKNMNPTVVHEKVFNRKTKTMHESKSMKVPFVAPDGAVYVLIMDVLLDPSHLSFSSPSGATGGKGDDAAVQTSTDEEVVMTEDASASSCSSACTSSTLATPAARSGTLPKMSHGGFAECDPNKQKEEEDGLRMMLMSEITPEKENAGAGAPAGGHGHGH